MDTFSVYRCIIKKSRLSLEGKLPRSNALLTKNLTGEVLALQNSSFTSYIIRQGDSNILNLKYI